MGVHVRVGTPDELDAQALGAAEEQRTRILPFFLARDDHPGSTDPASEPGPFAHSERDVIDTGRSRTVLGVPQAQDLVAEKKEGVVGALSDHVHPKLLDEEATRLDPVLDPNVHVVEAEEPKVSRGDLVRHDPPRLSPRYIGSVRVTREPDRENRRGAG